MVKSFLNKSRQYLNGSGLSLAGGSRRRRYRGSGVRRGMRGQYSAPSYMPTVAGSSSFLSRNKGKIALAAGAVATAAIAHQFGPQIAAKVGPAVSNAAFGLSRAMAGRALPSMPNIPAMPNMPSMAKLRSAVSSSRGIRMPNLPSMPNMPTMATLRSLQSITRPTPAAFAGSGRRRRTKGGALRLAGRGHSYGGPVHVMQSKLGLTNLPQAY